MHLLKILALSLGLFSYNFCLLASELDQDEAAGAAANLDIPAAHVCEGVSPNTLFENAARVRSEASKEALAQYVGFKLSQNLPELGMELISCVKGRNAYESIFFRIRNSENRHVQSFYYNLPRESQSFQDSGEALIALCLSMVKLIMEDDLLQENVRSWNFKIDAHNLPTEAYLSYLTLSRINIADDRYFAINSITGSATFRGDRVVSAIYKRAQQLRRTEFVCVITMEVIAPETNACYFDCETSSNGTKFYYDQASIERWVGDHQSSPRTRDHVTLADIKFDLVPRPADIKRTACPRLSVAPSRADFHVNCLPFLEREATAPQERVMPLPTLFRQMSAQVRQMTFEGPYVEPLQAEKDMQLEDIRRRIASRRIQRMLRRNIERKRAQAPYVWGDGIFNGGFKRGFLFP